MLRILRRLNFKFSIDKKQITFSFKVPYQHQQTPKTQPKNTVKTSKLARKKLDDPALVRTNPQYESGYEHLSTTQAAYEQNIKSKIEENVATRRFYEYEMKRGQDLIDNIPVQPYYEYKVADLKLEVQARKKQIDKFTNVQAFVDPNRLQKLKSAIAGYQTMKHRFEYEEFLKKLKDYKGSIKGPNPEDDPVQYGKYVRSIIPDWVQAELNLQNQTSIGNQQQSKETVALNPASVTDFLSNDRKFSNFNEEGAQGEEGEEFVQAILQDIDNSVTIVPYSQVPVLPQIEFEEYHSYMQKIRMWNKFRKYYDKANFEKTEQKFKEMIKNISNAYIQGSRLQETQHTSKEMQKLRQQKKKFQQILKKLKEFEKQNIEEGEDSVKKSKLLQILKKIKAQIQINNQEQAKTQKKVQNVETKAKEKAEGKGKGKKKAKAKAKAKTKTKAEQKGKEEGEQRVNAQPTKKDETLNRPKIQLKPTLYSLYTYYKTLPKQIQQNPGVRTVYLGLQYSQPDIPYEQKEQILNQAAFYSLPLDKFSTAAMQKLISKSRDLVTPHEADRALHMPPQFTWDILDFYNELKEEKLRSMSTVKEKQEFFPEPPELHMRWEQGMANLPVDFYDNDDGFWDGYIDHKLKKYQQVQPLSFSSRKHLIH